MCGQLGEGMAPAFWTNPSVIAFSSQRDPIEAITTEARKVVFNALELGWEGPPFDPFALAELLSIETRPSSEVIEARTVPIEAHRFRIEFNPDRPRRRMRYSVFHEIAHTLFPDCADMIRHRGKHNASRPDDWQLETLCNVAAAEFLLPTGALGQPSELQPTVDAILKLREDYEASAEAALLRIQRLTPEPAVAFSCHRDQSSSRYLVEYASPTPSITWSLPPGSLLPARTAASECTAIGYTAKGKEHWPRFGEVWIECVGIAAFPRDILPRVIGFVRPPQAQPIKTSQIAYVRGDATQTRGEDRKLLLQVVNDGAFTWGGHGFAGAVRRRWPAAQRAYTEQVTSDRSMLKLGNVLTFDVERDVTLASLVAQHGFGESPRPRIRYGALKDGLLRVSEIAKRLNASVHMPRIGAGQAGGAWPVIEEIISETLSRVGINVLVYDLPQGRQKSKPQGDLPLTQ